MSRGRRIALAAVLFAMAMLFAITGISVARQAGYVAGLAECPASP